MKKILLGAALLAAASGVQAAGVGLKLGTTGLGGDVAFSVLPTMSVRAGYAAFNHTMQIEQTDIKYDADIRLKNPSLLLDFSPPVFPLRFTAGLIHSGNKADITGTPTGGKFEFNDQTYDASNIGAVKGQVKGQRSTAPYLGIGWGNVAGAGVNFYADIGVMFMGGGKSTLDVECTAAGAAVCADPTFQANVDAERKKLEEEVRGFKYYPVVSMGVTVGF